MRIIKIIFLSFIFSLGNIYGEELYKTPDDVLFARDKAVLKLNQFRNQLMFRYIYLSKKRELTVAEMREMQALDAIIYDKDSEKLLKIWEKEKSK